MPVSMFSPILLSKKTCIPNMLKIIGSSNKRPKSLVFGIIMRIPAKI